MHTCHIDLLKTLIMLRELHITLFYIRFSSSLPLSPHRHFHLTGTPPPSISIMMLCCLTLYPGFCCFSSHLRGPYFLAFSLPFPFYFQATDNSFPLLLYCLLVIGETSVHSVHLNTKDILDFSQVLRYL